MSTPDLPPEIEAAISGEIMNRIGHEPTCPAFLGTKPMCVCGMGTRRKTPRESLARVAGIAYAAGLAAGAQVEREPQPSAPPEGLSATDLPWALERVERLRDSAIIDASVYGPKLLKGHGYPNETFRAAQDARALSIVLAHVCKREPRP